MTDRLSRQPHQPAAPVRILHLGLGNFFRAHQAWYTAQAPDADEWGIAAFTGRRPDAARLLAPQDGLYTLIVRRPDGDELEVVPSLSAVHTAGDHVAFLDYLRDEALSIITLTITEGGYMRRQDGGLDLDHEAVIADIETLRNDPTGTVTSAPGKLVAGLLARQAAEAGPITILSCDNLPGNGAATERVVRELASKVDADLLPWIDENVDFATSMVDRITPAATDADRATVREQLGMKDASPVVTEPFSEWVISGEFPAGRPRWEDAGVSIVDDVEIYEQRKLLLLNGAHSLMAYAATTIGHETVADAIGDPRVRGWVEDLWNDAAPSLKVPAADVVAYRAALVERFENPRMRDFLPRIAADGSQKIPVRIVPVVEAERAAGRLPQGAVRALGAWIGHLRGLGAAVNDVQGDSWLETASGEVTDAVTAVLDRLGLGGDVELNDAVTQSLLAFDREAAGQSAH